MVREDLRGIVRYIGKDNPTQAKSFGKELRDRTKPLAQHPELGRKGRPGLPDAGIHTQRGEQARPQARLEAAAHAGEMRYTGPQGLAGGGVGVAGLRFQAHFRQAQPRQMLRLRDRPGWPAPVRGRPAATVRLAGAGAMVADFSDGVDCSGDFIVVIGTVGIELQGKGGEWKMPGSRCQRRFKTDTVFFQAAV